MKTLKMHVSHPIVDKVQINNADGTTRTELQLDRIESIMADLIFNEAGLLQTAAFTWDQEAWTTINRRAITIADFFQAFAMASAPNVYVTDDYGRPDYTKLLGADYTKVSEKAALWCEALVPKFAAELPPVTERWPMELWMIESLYSVLEGGKATYRSFEEQLQLVSHIEW